MKQSTYRPSTQASRKTMSTSKKGQKGIYQFQSGEAPVDHTALLNHLIKLYGFKSYLEIGVRRRDSNYSSVLISNKIGKERP